MEKPNIFAKNPANLVLDAGKYFWCQCGLSTKNPFCDGSHKVTSFTPLKFDIESKKEVWLCQCKQTANAPYCDGTHKTL